MGAAATNDFGDYDITDPATRADPWTFYARLREVPQIQRVRPFGHYLVTRYDDVVDVLARPDDFSSIEIANQLGPIEALGTLLGLDAIDLPPTIISCDNPLHNQLRAIMQGRFSPRAVTRLDSPVTALTNQLIGGMRDRGEVDFVRDFAIPLPVIVIAQMLGIDEERFEDFKRWSDALIAVASLEGEPRDLALAKLVGLIRYLFEMAERRAAEPRDDLISVLVAAEDEAAGIGRGITITYVILLLVAGNETTTNLIGGMIEALLDNPDECEKLRRDPSLINNTVEEALRFCSPVQGLFRRAATETTIGETPIPEGAPLMVCYASANRDAARFPEPDRFDIARDASRHVAFGRGLHFCLGANLARREARITLERLLPLLPRMRRTREEKDWIDSWFMRGPKSLPLEFV